MSTTIPTIEPTEIVAGNTVAWTKSLSDYPASSGWTLKYVLHPLAGGTKISITASASGADHAVSVDKATTAAWAAAKYRWDSYVESSTERYSVESGLLTILPDPASVAGSTDRRSHARKVLDAIEAVLEGTASHEQESMTLEGQSLTRRSIEDLLRLRAVYQAEVDREETLLTGAGSGGRYLMRL